MLPSARGSSTFQSTGRVVSTCTVSASSAGESGWAAAVATDAGAPETGSPIVAFDAGPAGGINLSAFTTLKCENPGPGKTPPERCDHLTFFEDGLAHAIRDNAACAPSSKTLDGPPDSITPFGRLAMIASADR